MNLTRRNFLTGGGMAAGGLIATAALPALADDPSVFPQRGRFERLSLQFFEIEAGATKPFTVLAERLTSPFARRSPLIVMELPFIQP